MDVYALVEQLELLAERLGVAVRFESIEGPGGLCRIKGEQVLFVNKDLDADDQALVMGAALSRLDIDSVFMPPQVRELLEAYRSA